MGVFCFLAEIFGVRFLVFRIDPEFLAALPLEHCEGVAVFLRRVTADEAQAVIEVRCLERRVLALEKQVQRSLLVDVVWKNLARVMVEHDWVHVVRYRRWYLNDLRWVRYLLSV